MIASAKARVRSFRSTCVTNSPANSAFRIPHSALESPFFHVPPLLPRHFPPIGVQLLLHDPQHLLDFPGRRSGVDRPTQMRMQLLRRTEYGDRGDRRELAALQVEARPADHLAVCVHQNEVLERGVE